jgi:NTP pyrophosphatase (non-canonical NTP hydrolase)
MSDVLQELREKGNSRRDRWHTPDTEPWTGADWSNAMCGEAGEAASVVKKLRRIETGIGSQDGLTQQQLVQMLADELGDVLAYADLLAQHYGIELRRAVAVKFNRVSEREGFPERIEL